jgi:hypothetical protein
MDKLENISQNTDTSVVKTNITNNNVYWLWINSFLTDISSEMIKPLLPIYLKVVLQTPVWIITLFNTLSEFLSNLFKIYFWLKSDKERDKKKLLLKGYLFSNVFKPFIFIIQSIYWVFFIELLNRIWKWIRTAPKETLMVYSIEENKLWKGFWFQKAMDSLWAFLWTLLISLLLYIFWLEYNTTFLWFEFNLFYIIMFLTIIPWFLSYYVILSKVKNVYIEDTKLKEYENSKKKKIEINFKDIFNLWEKYNTLLIYIALFSIWNIAVVFFILELINKWFEAYQITLLYSLYSLIDAVFSYILWVFSDRKWSSKHIINFSTIALLIALFIPFLFSIENNFYWIILAWITFMFLGLFEAWYEWTFKKVIVNNIEKEKTWTAIWLYFWVWGIIKIIATLIFSFAWMNGKTEQVFLLWWMFIFLSIIYLKYITYLKKINI